MRICCRKEKSKMNTNLVKRGIILIIYLVILLSFYSNGATQTLSFTDITGTALGDTQEGTHSVVFADVTGDSRPDLYMTRYRTVIITDLFYRNTDGTTFSKKQVEYGIADSDWGSHGACFADLDNDGDYDLINGATVIRVSGTVVGGDNNDLYRNNSNAGFTKVTPTIMTNRKEKTRATLALDLDNNGYLDIYTVTGAYGNDDPTDEDNEIYMNNGGWSFSTITEGALYNVRIGQGATDTDWDNDGDIDVIAANRTGVVRFLQNDGSGTATSITASTIGVNHWAEDGITMGDVDNDGDLDVLLVSAEPSEAYLYFNDGSGVFSHLSQNWTNFNGYMGGFADLNNDCFIDLIFAGDTKYHYLLNNGLGLFIDSPSYTITYDESPPIYEPVQDPRGIGFADIDDDGDMDFAFGDKLGKGHLIRNDLTPGNHYLKLNLVSSMGQAGAFGAKAYVYAGGNLNGTLLGFREARSSNGYLAQNDPVLHFGMGSNTTADIKVKFLDGTIATRTHVAVDQTVTIDRSDMMIELLVFLEGPYVASGDSMSTALQSNGYLPTASPYSEDPRSIDSIPAGTVDWILVELRETPSGSAIASKSALLRKDGRIVGDDGTTEYITMDVAAGSYYVVMKHRNHITVMSASTVTLSSTSSTLYDFSTAASQNYGSSVKEVETGIYGLYAGNAEATDQDIFAGDLAIIRVNFLAGAYGYNIADTNMDGDCFASDYALGRINMLAGVTSSVPNP